MSVALSVFLFFLIAGIGVLTGATILGITIHRVINRDWSKIRSVATILLGIILTAIVIAGGVAIGIYLIS